jgi:transglutaminase-like putative cysteine protease
VEILPRHLPEGHAGFVSIQALPNSILSYLLPSRYCESDRLAGLAWEVVGDASPGYEQVARISQWVGANIPYRPGSSNVPISAAEVRQRGEGVCRDLAHLAIALCRALSIPARLVSGYLAGLEPMDLHAWFEAWVGDDWHTFDPTRREAGDLRVVVAVGRDAADVPLFNQFGPQLIPETINVSVDDVTERSRS